MVRSAFSLKRCVVASTLIASFAQADVLFTEMPQAHERSAIFIRMHDDKVLYAQDEDKLLTPASVSKLLTSAALLRKYGATYTYSTHFYYRGKRVGSRINGDLVVVGSGDPFLINEKLWTFAADLKHMGIEEFTGDIVIDNSLFEDSARDESRAGGEERSEHAYDAPVTAFGLNFNTFALAVTPGSEVGGAAHFDVFPYPLASISMKNLIKTWDVSRKTQIKIARTSSASSTIVGEGGITNNEGIRKIYRSVGDPVQSNGAILKSFLLNAGITVKGSIREGNAAASDVRLHSIESYDLGFMVEGLNHFSNNYIADALVKKLGSDFGRPKSGSIQSGVEVIKDFLVKDVGIRSKFEIFNGSGLNTKNRISARQLVAVLLYMEDQFESFPEFLSGLPVAGKEGTLEKRFHGNPDFDLGDKIRAKTGTLSSPVSVSALAGYLKHPKHGLVAFAIIDNGVVGKAQPSILTFRERQDRAITKFMSNF